MTTGEWLLLAALLVFLAVLAADLVWHTVKSNASVRAASREALRRVGEEGEAAGLRIAAARYRTAAMRPPVLDLQAISDEWLNQCGPCDYGMPEYGCACAKGDHRPLILDLVREVERLRALADVEVSDAPVP